MLIIRKNSQNINAASQRTVLATPIQFVKTVTAFNGTDSHHPKGFDGTDSHCFQNNMVRSCDTVLSEALFFWNCCRIVSIVETVNFEEIL